MAAALMPEPAISLREPPLVFILPTDAVVPDWRVMLPEEVVIVPMEALVAEVREILPEEYVCKLPVVAAPPDWMLIAPPLVSFTLPAVTDPLETEPA